jgi:hypothetical protein
MLSKNLALLAVAGLGYFAMRGIRMPRPAALPPTSQDKPTLTGDTPVQPRKASGWDMVDERADKSFPASDPPGTY